MVSFCHLCWYEDKIDALSAHFFQLGWIILSLCLHYFPLAFQVCNNNTRQCPATLASLFPIQRSPKTHVLPKNQRRFLRIRMTTNFPSPTKAEIHTMMSRILNSMMMMSLLRPTINSLSWSMSRPRNRVIMSLNKSRPSCNANCGVFASKFVTSDEDRAKVTAKICSLCNFQGDSNPALEANKWCKQT